MSALVIAGLLWLAYIIFLDQREFNKFTKEAREQEYIDKVIRDFDKEKEQQEFTKPVEPHQPTKLKHDRYKYLKYIQSPEWRKKSLKIKQEANFRCKSCNSPTNLQTHHISYKNLYNEQEGQLVCLCGDCHQELHDYHGKSASYYPLIRTYQA